MSPPFWLRIASAYAALFLAAAVLVGLIFGSQIEERNTAAMRARLEAEARAVAVAAVDQFAGGRAGEESQALAKTLGGALNARVTLIGADGRVLGDSEEDPASMENHLGRPEVQQALAGPGRIGYAERHSESVDRDMVYVAAPVGHPEEPASLIGVVRVALPRMAIEEARFDLWRNIALVVTLVALPLIVVALLLARGMAAPLQELSRVVRRFGSGDLSRRSVVGGGGEVAQLARDFNTMADRLAETIRERTAQSNQMAAVLANMTDAIITTDPRGIITGANPSALRFFPAGQPQERTLIEFTHEHELHLALKRVLAAPRRTEKLEVTSGRRALAATVTAVPAADSGQPTGLVVLQDVTELRRLERVRRDFVANIGHELRTPLASIKLLAETLETAISDDPESARRFLHGINVEIDRLTQLVRELLELSRIESGQAQLRLEAISPLELLESAAARLAQQAERARLSLAIEPPGEELPLVFADGTAVEQVLVNLLHNAIKFTPPGGSVTLRARRHQRGVELSVADTGEGIDPEDLPRLFERFYKVDKARSGGGREGGTGLGLAIAKHIVQAHGGTIEAESKPGAGSTFSFTLPPAGEQRGS